VNPHVQLKPFLPPTPVLTRLSQIAPPPFGKEDFSGRVSGPRRRVHNFLRSVLSFLQRGPLCDRLKPYVVRAWVSRITPDIRVVISYSSFLFSPIFFRGTPKSSGSLLSVVSIHGADKFFFDISLASSRV